MSKRVDFYYDYVSPYSYLAYTQRRRIEEAGGELIHHPIFLGGLNATIGNTPPIERAGKKRGAYMFKDLMRWAVFYELPMAMNPFFPMSTLHLLRGAALAESSGCIDAYSEASFAAVWEQGLDVSDMAVARAIAEGVGLDGDAFERAARDPANKAQVKDGTQAAIDRGVFGAPTFFFEGEMYFGNDRLMFLLRSLKDEW